VEEEHKDHSTRVSPADTAPQNRTNPNGWSRLAAGTPKKGRQHDASAVLLMILVSARAEQAYEDTSGGRKVSTGPLGLLEIPPPQILFLVSVLPRVSGHSGVMGGGLTAAESSEAGGPYGVRDVNGLCILQQCVACAFESCTGGNSVTDLRWRSKLRPFSKLRRGNLAVICTSTGSCHPPPFRVWPSCHAFQAVQCNGQSQR
jgi:hypothetical protein